MESPNPNLSPSTKLALIIGIDDYRRSENKLNNSVDNANRLSVLLENINFTVTKPIDNVNEDKIQETVKNFAKDIKDGDLILFYFSGHGCQVDGENYLIPEDDSGIDSDQNLKELANSLERIISRLTDEKLPPHTTILILDCCRPYVLEGASASTATIKNGLCRIKNAPPRTFIQFSCSENETSDDELFMKHLLQNITLKNVNVIDVFDKITEDVYEKRKRSQRPLSIYKLSDHESIYLNQVECVPVETIVTPRRNSSDREKLALIIGNGNYRRSIKRANNFIKNAEKLRDQLEKINFKITMNTDITADIMNTVRDFTRKIKDGDLVLVYFSGFSYHIEDNNYLLPVGDNNTETDINFEDNANNAKRILDRLVEKNPSYVTILILDCCSSYLLRSKSTPNLLVRGNGLSEMVAPPGTFIQFSCSANQTSDDPLFIKHLLQNITLKNVDVTEVFRRIRKAVYPERHERKKPLSINGIWNYDPVYLNQGISSLPNIPFDAIWKTHARTVAGGRGSGSTMNRLHSPQGISISHNQTILIADSSNHRIMKYNINTREIQRIAGKNIKGYGPNLLAEPSNAIFDTASKSFIICDYHNRRVLQRFLRSKTSTKTIIENIACFGLAMDDEGCLYVSDTERHEVRKYRPGKKYAKIVAGGHGQGRRLHQLNHPTYICVGDDQSVYVSDSWNDRVMKWAKGAKEGIIVAGEEGKGKGPKQLDYPAGVVIDRLGTIYVADHYNDRVMRWRNGKLPDIIVGDRFLSGSDENRLIGPEGLAFDRDGNLYVADSNNHRIQRFNIQTT